MYVFLDFNSLSILEAVLWPGVRHSDEFSAYKSLNDPRGFIHRAVNHRHNFIDPGTGTHSQGIEKSWMDGLAKIKILRRKRRVPRQTLQGHIDYYCWTRININCDDLFAAFVQAIKA